MRRMLEKPFRPTESGPRVDAIPSRDMEREEIYRTYQHILRGYAPGRYPGRVVLLRTDDAQSRVPNDPTLGWRHVTPHLEVCPIPGNHHTCLTEQVESLAECLASYLRRSS